MGRSGLKGRVKTPPAMGQESSKPCCLLWLPDDIATRLDRVRQWTNTNAESIVGTLPGLEPWQFYGPSTRRRKRSARILGNESQLFSRARNSIAAAMTTRDPLASVIALDFDGWPEA